MKTKITPIQNLGEAKFPSPLVQKEDVIFISDDDGVIYENDLKTITSKNESEELLSFEYAGPRKNIHFNPEGMVCGIVTCGGLCPGYLSCVLLRHVF